MNEPQQHQSPEWTTRPDPTLLTTAALQREVSGLKELVATRLDAMDKAISLLQAQADREPQVAVVNENVKSLKEIINKQFESIALQFKERDERAAQGALNSKLLVDTAFQSADKAVNAALTAAEKAVAMQTATAKEQMTSVVRLAEKSIEATDNKITEMQKTSDSRISDLKVSTDARIADLNKRMDTREGQSKGVETSYGMVIGLGGLAMTIVGLAIAMIGLYLKTQ